MILLQTESFFILRAATGYEGYDDGNGNWIPAKETTNRVKAKGSIQPITGNDLAKLPESFKNVEALKVYTKQELRTVDDTINQEPDILEIDGERYQVAKVEKWRQLSTNHYKAYVRLEEKE